MRSLLRKLTLAAWGSRPPERRRSEAGFSLPERRSSEAGFTLIELLVSALVLVVLGAAVAESLISTASVSGDERRHSQAAEIAQQDQERLRGLSVAQLNSLGQVPPRTVTVGGTTYTVTSTSRFLNNTGGPSCQPGAAAYFKIDSKVDWSPNLRGAVVVESIIAPPAGGTIRAQVVDQIGSPVAGVTVSASGPDVESAPTDTTGCAVLSGLPSGSYGVTYGTQGYVDPDGNLSPPNITAQVTSTGNSTPSTDPVTMGLAGTFVGNFKAYAGGNATAGGEADYLSWYGSGAAVQMTNSKSAQSTSTQPATSIASTGLFPFAFTPTTTPTYTNNYQVWAGECPQMQPPAGVNTLSVPPGSTQNSPGLTVAEPELDVLVYNSAPTRIKPSHVKITFTSSTGPNCSDSWQPTLSPTADTNPKGVLANPGQPFVTSTTGASASGFTGTMTVCADNGSVHKTSTPLSDSYSAPTQVPIDLGSGTSPGLC